VQLRPDCLSKKLLVEQPVIWYAAVRGWVLSSDWLSPRCSKSGMPHRVFIVDDNPAVRTGIRALLETSGFEI
jgi:hypothetical protein